MTRLKITASVQDGDHERQIVVRGQTARALAALVNARERGCTALEVSSWAYRFAAYCHDLRHKFGLAVRTVRVDHPEGWHGRHVLETPVSILKVENDNDGR